MEQSSHRAGIQTCLLVLISLLGMLSLLGSNAVRAAGKIPGQIERPDAQAGATAVSPAQDHVLYLPLVSKWSLPPMVSLDSLSITDGNGAAKSVFLPGDPIRYKASGTNPNLTTATVRLTWDWQSGCGSSQVVNATLTIPPGNWTHTQSGVAPACSDLYLNTVRVATDYQSATLQTLFAVNLASQSAYEYRQGFDRCYLPATTDMQTWWDHSPYWVYNIYLGGSMFYCQDDIPDPFWVHIVSSQGWKLILTWVGPQAPCSAYRDRMSADSAAAYQEGRLEADAAVAAARRLGFLGGGVIYYDLEAYSSSAPLDCRTTVSSFMRGWTKRLHDWGFFAGGYGSPVTSYIGDWASNNPPPDYIWIAHYVLPYQYDSSQTVWSKYLSNSLWSNHQRIRQYAGGHDEVWGDLPMTIDSNALDGVVTRIPTTTLSMAAQPGQSFSASPLLRSVGLLSPTAGWALRDNALLLTKDGGQSWTEISPPPSADESTLGVAFLDDQHAWLVRQAADSILNDRLNILRTADGGQTWDPITLQLPPSALSGQPVAAAFPAFKDPQTGWLALRLASGSSFSLGRLFFTRDGGRTWEERSLPLGEAVSFRDDKHGWTAGGPGGEQLFTTDDGGLTWQPQEIPLPEGIAPRRFFVGLPNFNPSGIGTLPVTISAASGSELLVYQSTDGGQRWSLHARQALEGAASLSAPLPFSPLPSSGWLAATPSNGQIYELAPGGAPAALSQVSTLPAGVVAIDFVSPQQGWALVRQGDCSGQKSVSAAGDTLVCEQFTSLVATSDGGLTWTVILK